MHACSVPARAHLFIRVCLRARTGAGKVARKLLLNRSYSSKASPAKLPGSSEMRLCDSTAFVRSSLSQNGTNASRSASCLFAAARPPAL